MYAFIQGNAEIPVIHHRINKGSERLVNPDTELYFLAKCFPFTFMPAHVWDGTQMIWDVPTDYNCVVARNQEITFSEYAKQLTKINPRFMSHPSLKFVLLNIKNRKSLFGQINYELYSDDGKLPQSRGAMIEMAKRQNDADGFIHNLTNRFSSWSSRTTGTPQYWWSRAGELRAFVDHMLSHAGTSPLFFHSGSAAEYYWRPLHRLLCKYFDERGIKDYAVACQFVADGKEVPQKYKQVVHRAIIDAPHIINRFFVLRTESWFSNVLKPVYGIDA